MDAAAPAARGANAETVDAASPALRSPGFTVTANGHALLIQRSLQRQQQLESAFDGQLHAGTVHRGHRTRLSNRGVGRPHATLGFPASPARQRHGHRLRRGVLPNYPRKDSARVRRRTNPRASKNSPIHVHEALFGWEGWSLSAPRPGKPISNVGGEEHPQEEPAGRRRRAGAPAAHRDGRSRKGTLPRLRYGRSYAFRAWAVDLAGNSRPARHEGRSCRTAGPSAAAAGATYRPASLRRRGPPRRCAQRPSMSCSAANRGPRHRAAQERADAAAACSKIPSSVRQSRSACARCCADRGVRIAAVPRRELSRRALVKPNIGRAVADLEPTLRSRSGKADNLRTGHPAASVSALGAGRQVPCWCRASDTPKASRCACWSCGRVSSRIR